jgi:hypothetical protein
MPDDSVYIGPHDPLSLQSEDVEGTITFSCGDKELMKFDSKGDIYVKGRLTDNDLEVVNTFKEWLKSVSSTPDFSECDHHDN